MMKAKLIMTLGLPASGKSTWAKEQWESSDMVWVSKDDIREALHDGKFSKENEKEVIAAQTETIKLALKNGQDVIVDNTNFGWEDRLKAIADEYGADFEIKDFTHVPLSLCLDRNERREKKVPKHAILRMHQKWIQGKNVYTTFDKSKKKAIVVDIDGTLAHMGDRSPYDGSKVHLDTVDQAVGQIIDDFEELGYDVFLLSGRDEKYRSCTVGWLIEHKIDYYRLIMRKEGDNRCDSIVKEELYREHVEPTHSVRYVFDDRKRVVDMWRRIGLKTFQVEDGDF